MLIHPQFDPIALQLGPLAIRWYGLMYLLAFLQFLYLARQRIRQAPFAQQGWSGPDIDDLLFAGVLGVILGGRLGYVLFYKPAEYGAHPLEIFMVWQGGMAFHGGLLGVIVALFWFSWSRQRQGKPFAFWQVTDLVAPCVPLGLAFGRLGNFINGELWGRAADATLPWAMVFPQSGTAIARHPSQIYQFALEGLLLFVVLWLYARKPRAAGQTSGLFLVGYGSMRFLAEYFREPDAYLGLLSLGLSMGQWLCVPMITFGLVLMLRSGARPS
jgi:phosphatidylglycerol:prolipoprotein diacylglycerol transferase